MPKPALTCFRIIDNPAEDPRAPFALLDKSGTIVRVHNRVGYLADLAFDELGADEVRHDENLIRSAEVRQ